MRKLTKYAEDDVQILENLEILADRSIPALQYSQAFYKLGEKLSIQLNKKISKAEKVVIACSTEDADWLTKGIIDNLQVSQKNLVVFWNLRTSPFDSKDILIAPIIKTYSENIENCDVLIICKSIIYTSCVVRTNLTYLIQKIDPKLILIAAPVIFKSAEKNLMTEFDKSISTKFQFIYFAKDSEVNSSGEVLPGIGGEVFKRLGLENVVEKNKYIPELVRSRRLEHSH